MVVTGEPGVAERYRRRWDSASQPDDTGSALDCSSTTYFHLQRIVSYVDGQGGTGVFLGNWLLLDLDCDVYFGLRRHHVSYRPWTDFLYGGFRDRDGVPIGAVAFYFYRIKRYRLERFL